MKTVTALTGVLLLAVSITAAEEIDDLTEMSLNELMNITEVSDALGDGLCVAGNTTLRRGSCPVGCEGHDFVSRVLSGEKVLGSHSHCSSA